MATPQDVLTYIRDHWDDSVRDRPGRDNVEPIPFRYASPCIEGTFIALFYWDTYWTNVGLLAQGRTELAKSNTDALLYLQRTLGFVPNSIFRNCFNRSQPPYLTRMVREVHAVTGDDTWLAEAFDALEAEHRFWSYQRATPVGLTRHGHHAHSQYLDNFYGALVNRIGLDAAAPTIEKRSAAAHHLAEAETGWDFNPRFDQRCLDHAPIDLNALMVINERTLAEMAQTIGRPDAADRYRDLAGRRSNTIRDLCWDESAGLFRDYDYINEKPSPVATLATVFALWAGVATDAQAQRVRESLKLFRRDHGLAVCEQLDDDRYYQWGFPNAWPPLTYVAMEAMAAYGFDDEADAIARTWVEVNTRLFEKTGQLWEKIDVTTGEVAGGEYEAQPMLGWSAGTFIACCRRLGIEA